MCDNPVILERKDTRDKDINIVLAFLPSVPDNGREPRYVTWVENCTNKERPPFYVLGHYYATLRPALNDYVERA